MFGGVNVWRIAEFNEIGEIKVGELIDFSHRDVIYKLKFGWLKFGESRTTRQFHQTFPPPNIPAIRYGQAPAVIWSGEITYIPYSRWHECFNVTSAKIRTHVAMNDVRRKMTNGEVSCTRFQYLTYFRNIFRFLLYFINISLEYWLEDFNIYSHYLQTLT